MYSGDRLDAMPIATPPRMRQTTNRLKLPAQPVNTDETANKNAAKISSRLRPNLSLRPPASSEPSRHPSRAQLLAKPLRASGVTKPCLLYTSDAADDLL